MCRIVHSQSAAPDASGVEYEEGFEDKDSVTEFVFEVILLSGISLFGLIGNISAIVLFTTMKRQLKFHRLMMMLSAFDLIYVALSFMLFALPKVSNLFLES